MGQRGPTPQPASLKLLQGNPGKRAIDLDAGVNPPVAIPAPPRHLNKYGLAEWKRITPLLFPLGLITELDRAKLSNYCHAWGRLQEVALRIRDLQKNATEPTAPLWGTVGQNGAAQISALAILESRYMEQVHKYAGEFGLSPVDRVSIKPSAATGGHTPELPGVEPKPAKPTLATFGPRPVA